jgi:hypothetical protein
VSVLFKKPKDKTKLDVAALDRKVAVERSRSQAKGIRTNALTDFGLRAQCDYETYPRVRSVSARSIMSEDVTLNSPREIFTAWQKMANGRWQMANK